MCYRFLPRPAIVLCTLHVSVNGQTDFITILRREKGHIYESISFFTAKYSLLNTNYIKSLKCSHNVFYFFMS